MPALKIDLVRPADDTRLVGSGNQRLTAALAAPAPVPLFYKWYSSLAADPLGTALDLPSVALPLGSQVLTLAAKDQALDTPDALQAVVHAGMAGGPPETGQPCRVHVLIAELREPAPGATLNRGNATLSARAPAQWGRKRPDPSTVYDPNPDYLALNKLRWRWRFAPSGAPAGRPGGELVPTSAQWTFVPPRGDGGNQPPVPLLRYRGPLPAGLSTGSYTLTLRVEHVDNAAQGHEHSIGVNLS